MFGSKKGQAAIEWSSGSTARSKAMRGQAATEVMVLTGFAVAFILPLAFLFLSASQSEVSKSSVLQAKASARTIADSAWEVYLQGSGAKKTILVHYPPGIVNGTVEGGLVVLRVDTDRGLVDVAASTTARIGGDLTGRKGQGIHRIIIENVEDASGAEQVLINYDNS